MWKALPITVHFKSDSLANIIALRDVVAMPGVSVTMDSSRERAITVTTNNGNTFKFIECPDGLYHYDTKVSGSSNKAKYSFVQTVATNKKFFTRGEIEGAEMAQRLQQQIVWPSVDQFKVIIANNLIRNSGVTVDDIERAKFLFGTPTPLLQGKMTRAPKKRSVYPEFRSHQPF